MGEYKLIAARTVKGIKQQELAKQPGETIYLIGEAETEAKVEQEAHAESNATEGIIREFVNRTIPLNWDKRTLSI